MKAFNLSAELYLVARSTASRIAHCAFFKSQEQPQQWLSPCDQWPVFRNMSCGVVSGNTLKHCLHVLLGLGVDSITGTRNIVSIFRKVFRVATRWKELEHIVAGTSILIVTCSVDCWETLMGYGFAGGV
jgi:hypothetical protein